MHSVNARRHFRANFFFSLAILISFCPLQPGDSAFAKPDAEVLKFAQGLSEVFEDVANQITPAVVNISASKKLGSGRGAMPDMSNPFFEQFREFFGDEFFEHLMPQQQAPRGKIPLGLGTGVIVDKTGHILTNNHVVNDADEVTVRLHDKRSFKATVVGTDPLTDVAVIKIDADNLLPATLGDSDRLRIGEWVIAAGNPFGLDHTITAGIVSAKGRANLGITNYEDFIQTDAAINPGNSGGPLVNLKGEVVGINTAIASRTGSYIGVGFAIPVKMARSVMDNLIKKGKVVRGWLGVGIQNLSEDLAKSFNYPGTDGALVGHIERDGPADEGRLKQGDIIVSYNGKALKDANDLQNSVAATEPGTTVNLDVIREGRKEALSVKITERKADESKSPSEDESQADLGITVEPLTPEIAQRLQSDRKNGVVVTSVLPGGPGAAAGLQPRDIIVSINGTAIDGVSAFKKAVNEKSLRKGLRMVVETQGMERFVFLKTE